MNKKELQNILSCMSGNTLKGIKYDIHKRSMRITKTWEKSGFKVFNDETSKHATDCCILIDIVNKIIEERGGIHEKSSD